MLEGESLGFHRDFPQVGPQNALGLEINDYAAELARVTVWIGDIQWGIRNGLGYSSNPILKKLDTIECRDALLIAGTGDRGTGIGENLVEAEWPAADCIVGNPPFLGDKKMLGELGEEYVTRLRQVYKGRVPGGADLVTYWFEKARAAIEAGQAQRAGLVATNSIRGGANRKILERICGSGRIFNAWSDEPWINEGAAVRVSLVCFHGVKSTDGVTDYLDDRKMAIIFADLTGIEAGKTFTRSVEHTDLTSAKRLAENAGASFMGIQKTGPFEVTGEQARTWLQLPSNPTAAPTVMW